MNNIFYVYIYWRLDTNEPFYVGKGSGDRWMSLHQRNKHFTNIINKHAIACEIIKNDLTEDEAHEIECWLINELVFEYGFSIDIKNANSNDHYCHLVNMTWGGEGTSGADHRGKKNPMYGIRICGERNKNSIPIICLTTNEIFKYIKEACDYYKLHDGDVSRVCQGKRRFAGKLEDGTPLVWMYLEDYKKATKEEIKRRIKKSLEKNYKGKDVICVTTKKIFQSVSEASEYYNIYRSSIKNCCRGYEIKKEKRKRLSRQENY